MHGAPPREPPRGVTWLHCLAAADGLPHVPSTPPPMAPHTRRTNRYPVHVHYCHHNRHDFIVCDLRRSRAPPPCFRSPARPRPPREEYHSAAPRRARTSCLPYTHRPHTPLPRLQACLSSLRSHPPLSVMSTLQAGPRPASYHPEGFYTGARSLDGPGGGGVQRGVGGVLLSVVLSC